MSAGIRGVEGLSLLPTATKSVAAKRRAFPLSGRFPRNHQCCFSQRRRKSAKALILRKPSASQCRRKIPTYGELAFALVIVARKLKPYFQAHTLNVLTDKPLRWAMTNPKVVGRLALWAIELSEFDIQYCPRIAIKGQVVSDFITEFTRDEDKGAEESPHWSIYTDGSSNRQVGGAGIVLLSPKGTWLSVWSVSTSPLPTMK